MSAVLLLKLSLVPALIAAITLAGRRWGPTVAGWLSAFPVVSGPILLFIAMEQGAAFAATSAAGTLSAVLAILAFGICYAWAATRFSWPVSLAAGFGGYFIAVAALHLWTPSLPYSMPAVLIALWLAPRLYPQRSLPQHGKPAAANDILFRMAAGAVLVLAVTHFAAQMGPTLSGVFAMFPVMGSVLVVFSHRHSGAAFAIHLLRGMILGYYAFGAFCAVLALTLRSIDLAPAFLVSITAAVLVQAVSRLQLQRAQRHASTDAVSGER
ncbi:MAG TPA: hypothetical protein VEC01_07800 [Noviherbaspirillum sp.]|uniref:hypothetical protein n=1 Tax=Noviherbaspirillum sp. TaxID=1926288 RepID=UPI002D65B5F5|nr:hypothetical protein [Noviherbaspirillum sp.]HYD95213.1 hypothetical protein [Noviherbaspirillum sp.]